MLQSLANQIIQHMEQDYDTIAGHFSSTRHDPWPEFELLKEIITSVQTLHATSLPPSLLDIGCGNGRLAAAIPAVHYTGLDLSRQLLDIAQQKFPHYAFVHGSMLQLPFPNEQFDLVACVAALQHIPSVSYRQQAMQEIVRVLKPGGTLFMLNWNLNDQAHYQPYLANTADGYDAGDYLIPWKNDQGVMQANRYYHGFGITEVAELTTHAGLNIIQNALGSDQRNVITVAKKQN